nr:GNAT family N-acetyltransferase [Mesorhizobium sp. INR15]
MPIVIVPANAAYVGGVENQDFSFLVDAFCEPEFGRSVADWVQRPVSPYWKDYRATQNETQEASDVGFGALDDQMSVGRILISHNWNDYCLVDDIAVDTLYRGLGVGRLLMDACMDWARAERLAGIMLETQNNNIAACRFYERYGFELGGIDRLLYGGLSPRTGEIALFWYFSSTGRADRLDQAQLWKTTGNQSSRNFCPGCMPCPG